jgi:hypothetical protein
MSIWKPGAMSFQRWQNSWRKSSQSDQQSYRGSFAFGGVRMLLRDRKLAHQKYWRPRQHLSPFLSNAWEDLIFAL